MRLAESEQSRKKTARGDEHPGPNCFRIRVYCCCLEVPGFGSVVIAETGLVVSPA